MAFDPNVTLAGAGAPGALYVVDRGGDDVAVFVPPAPAAPQVVPSSEQATGVTPTTATLQASVNPEFADTHYTFEYGPTPAYGTQIPLSPGTDIGESGREQSASAGLTGLTLQTTYHFRVVATNSVGTTYGPDATFTTSPPVLIDSELVTNVTATAADLRTGIDPEGFETHYRFEYGTTPAYGVDAPVPDGEIGAVETEQGEVVHVEGLEPGTKYYFRVVATNALGTVIGGTQTFTTFPLSGEPSTLPDDRVYELVSPPESTMATLVETIWQEIRVRTHRELGRWLHGELPLDGQHRRRAERGNHNPVSLLTRALRLVDAGHLATHLGPGSPPQS